MAKYLFRAVDKHTRATAMHTVLVSLLVTLSVCYYASDNNYLVPALRSFKKETLDGFHLSVLCCRLILQ